MAQQNISGAGRNQELRDADQRYMGFLIQQARARFAAMPATQKAQQVRFMEDEYAAAAAAGSAA